MNWFEVRTYWFVVRGSNRLVREQPAAPEPTGSRLLQLLNRLVRGSIAVAEPTGSRLLQLLNRLVRGPWSVVRGPWSVVRGCWLLVAIYLF